MKEFEGWDIIEVDESDNVCGGYVKLKLYSAFTNTYKWVTIQSCCCYSVEVEDAE